MKLKYKKIILLTTMSTMGIGLLTLSVSHDRSQAKESISTKATVEAGLLADSSSAKANILGTGLSDETNLSSFAPTAVPSPTPLPVYDIEEDAYPDINKLFVNFYKAKNNRDIDALKKLLSDPTKVESQKKLEKKTQYIEEYSKIKTYTKKGVAEGTYIVYVYHEIKFTGIKTPAPGLSKFYVVTGDDNKVKIFSGTMDDETQAYFDARNEDEDVVKLIKMTNDRSEEAMKKDEDLLTFWNSIDEMAAKGETAQGDSAE
jgi:hypothetical protein